MDLKDARTRNQEKRLGWSSYDKINKRGIFISFKISWFRNDMRCPREENRFSISKPSTVVFPSGHPSWKCALKSPVKNVAKGFSTMIFECKFLKFDKMFQIEGNMVKDWTFDIKQLKKMFATEV